MNATAVVVPFPVQRDVGEDLTAAEVAEIYVTLLDDLTAAIEQSAERGTVPGKAIVSRLGELMTALDELTLPEPAVAPAVLACGVGQLREYVRGCTFRSAALRKLFEPLDELHRALIRLADAVPCSTGVR